MGGLGEREGSDDEVEEEEIRVWDLGEENKEGCYPIFPAKEVLILEPEL